MSKKKTNIKSGYYDSQDAPAIASYGTNWVMVECPSSEEEETREAGLVEGRLKNTPTTTWVVADGAYYEPFDGVTRLDQNSNLPADPAGAVQYRTWADYGEEQRASNWIDVQ